MNDFEKRWQRISQLLSMEVTGKERPMVSSGRTIFGIKSTAEQKMDEFAKEIEEEHATRRKARYKAEAEGVLTEPENTTDTGKNAADTTFHANNPAKNAFTRSSVEYLTERAMKQAIRDANKKLEEKRQQENNG